MFQSVLKDFSKKLITIPGEDYPENDVSLIHSPISVEPCCGTHVFNTSHIQVWLTDAISISLLAARTFYKRILQET
jgi:alanyl-tRNA synthetase